MDLIHEGKAKRVFANDKSSTHVIIEFKDTITAGDGDKSEEIEGKGALACETTVLFFEYLNGKGVGTHFVKKETETRIKCKKLSIIPLEVVCRNVAAGSFCGRYGIEKGLVFSQPIVEFFIKDDNLHDPPITAEAAVSIGLASETEVSFMRSVTRSVNYYLSELLVQADLKLVDFKLEFGKTVDGHILLGDEVSGDTMRVWTINGESLDKDLFREDSGSVLGAYETLLEKLKDTNPEQVPARMEKLSVLVMPKTGIKNPPGDVTRKALERLGFKSATEVRMGKIFQITIAHPLTSEILNHLEAMNLKLLSNPISETTEVRMT